MSALDHEMILASAGSGKTYALTNRVVRLLALGAAPERIVALTFTRKAAGEFFDVILRKLARAASDSAYARQLAGEIAHPHLGCNEFLHLLRAMIDAMPRLNFGTFDAFFARIVRSFPLELGLSGDFEMLEDHATLVHRRRVLRRMFARAQGSAGPDPEQRVFIEAFKQATYGVEQKSVEALLMDYLDAHQEVFLEIPEGDLWGNPGRIWPAGCHWDLNTTGEALTRAVLQLRARLAARADLPDRQRRRLAHFLDALMEWNPLSGLPTAVRTPLKRSLEVWDQLAAGSAEVMIDRKNVTFAGDDAAALAAMIRAVVGAEMRRRLEVTRGLHAVLANYEAVYNQAVRRAGLLNFADVQRLLAPGGATPLLAAGIADGGEDSDDPETRRLAIDWRLDARFDHWLLDEFQDTSRGQWSVLRNLIDEVVQDDSGRRSFFYVGDAKQAIYAWREGDARLMREIAEHYNHGGTRRIVEKPLHQSWRSAPPVLAMINRVFSAHDEIARLVSADVAARWARDWAEHTPAHPGLEGQAAWIYAADDAARFKATLDLLMEIRPTERGMTSAVLVQKNDTAAELADYLRREGGLPAVAEADLHVCMDNPLSAAILALFQAAAHPGDSLAWHHIAMTPVRDALSRRGVDDQDALTRLVLGQVHREGFERAVATWIEGTEPYLEPDDTFSRIRGRQMAEAARLYDQTGGRDVAEFIQFMQQHKVREPESSGVIRIMTIHKSKGLGFDLVVLPDLEGKSIDARRRGLAVRREADRTPRWVLDLPAEEFHASDPELSAYVAQAEADAGYDKLALLYVAMTRAKQGMYLITAECGQTRSRNYPRLLATTLGSESRRIAIGSLALEGPFSAGNVRWFESHRPPSHRDEPRLPPRLDPTDATPAVRRIAVAPSRRSEGTVAAAALFAAAPATDPAAFGSSVHALLASVEWWDEALADLWQASRHSAGFAPSAVSEALRCLNAASSRSIFERPRTDVPEVWRERPFEIILDEAWVTGVFDRVHVERDAGGHVRRVLVYDFKTDRLADDADSVRELRSRYAVQMHLYRRAAAVLTGAPIEKVSCFLVPTGLSLGPVEISG